MITFPNAKINIGLNILSKREDGYHNLQTIFYPIGLKDALETIDADETNNSNLFTSTGLSINTISADNLCIKAIELLQKDFPQVIAQKIHLHKVIPMGAGLGGGSADAAFMLHLLNKKFQLNLSQEELIHYALQLGSDCPFFIINKPCFATGRGEILETVELDLSAYHFLIINPGIHINTGQAFSGIIPSENNQADLKAFIQQPVDEWKHSIINDFEKPVFNAYPEIAAIKDGLYRKGAVYAAMSGTGSTVYGIFKRTDRPDISFPSHYFCRWVH